MNVDENVGVPSRYGVLSLPTVILFTGGEAEGDGRRRTAARDASSASSAPLRVTSIVATLGRPARGRGARVLGIEPRRAAEARAAAGRARSTGRLRARRDRRHRPLPTPGRGLGGGAAWRERRRHDGHRVGEVARVQPAGHRRDRPRAEDPRALPLPDEGARAGSGAVAGGAPPEGAPPRDLRRRHAGRAPLADPQVVERDPHEPGHAPRRRSAAPRPLGRRPREPALRRRRRGARLPRRLRLARRERPPAAAPARADLRRRAAVPARLGDDRERRRAGADADRQSGDRWSTSDTSPRAEREVVIWNPPLVDAELGLRASSLGDASRLLSQLDLARAAHDLLREEPQGGGAHPPLHGRARRRRDRGAARAVSRRLHGRAAP